MKYAVLEIQDKQHMLKVGDQLLLNGTIGKENETFSMGRILLLNDEKLEIGTPEIKGEVQLKVLSYPRSPKIHVSTYKHKSRQRKHIGHRQDQTLVEVVALGSLKAEKTVKAAKVEKKVEAKTEKKVAAKTEKKPAIKAKTTKKAE